MAVKRTPAKPGSAAAKAEAAAAAAGKDPATIAKDRHLRAGGLWHDLEGHQLTLKPLIDASANQKLAGTLLFAGPSGIGKKFAARALAQALVCDTPLSERADQAGCGVCGPCTRITTGHSESLMVVEPDGAGIKIEQARDVLQFITLQKLGRARIVIIDQAHLLGPQSGNALLKSLEEPPHGTYFFLISQLPNAILATLRSRSQLVRFKPLNDEALSKILTAHGDTKPDAWLLKAANGSVEAAKRMNEERGEYETLENATNAYLSKAVDEFPSQEISELRELLKDRTTHGFVAATIQGQITNALKIQGGIKLRTSSPAEKLAEKLAKKSPRSLDVLARKSLAFESDLARNVDRRLLLEALAIDLNR